MENVKFCLLDPVVKPGVAPAIVALGLGVAMVRDVVLMMGMLSFWA